MRILKKNDNIKKYDEKKSYRSPQLKEIGRINETTKGSGKSIFLDSFNPLDGLRS